MAQPLEEKRCPDCRRLLFKATGAGATVQIKCTCGRLVLVVIDGR